MLRRASYLQQLRLAAAKTASASTEALQAAVDRAKKEAEEANAKLGRCELLSLRGLGLSFVPVASCSLGQRHGPCLTLLGQCACVRQRLSCSAVAVVRANWLDCAGDVSSFLRPVLH